MNAAPLIGKIVVGWRGVGWGLQGDEEVLAVMGSFMRQESGLLRVAAVLAIGYLGQGAKIATTIAMAALDDPDERVQAAAAHVLRESGL